MTSPCELISVECPKCGEVFSSPYRASINLGLDPSFSQRYIKKMTNAVCPKCRTRIALDSLIVDASGTWSFNISADASLETNLMDGLTDRFFADVDNIKQMNDPSTHLSYREFLAFFQQKAILAEHDVVIGAYFTYGWMPTILKKLSEPLQAVVEIANLVKSSQQITDAQFKQVASAINGSVVGASKFLHFINPETHAIWDSRVFRYLHQKEPYPERLVAPGAYWNYLRCLDAVARDQRFQKAKTLVETVVGYTVTNKRAAELVMYHNGKP